MRSSLSVVWIAGNFSLGDRMAVVVFCIINRFRHLSLDSIVVLIAFVLLIYLCPLLILTVHNPLSLLTSIYQLINYGTIETNTAFLDCLGELDGFISAQPFDNVIICGDFNVEFSCNTHNSHQLVDFMNTHNLVRADTSTNIQFTYRRDDLSVTSWPDHTMYLLFLTACLRYKGCLAWMVLIIFLIIYP